MIESIRGHLTESLSKIDKSGLYKKERVLSSQQGARIYLKDGQSVLNMCANNYLGLANHPKIVAAAREGLERWGFGLSSVRFICGTQMVHRELEEALSRFLGTEDTILYSSCFDANTGFFETLLTKEDVVISDQLNHASIIDGIRLCKARCLRFNNRDMGHLEERLKESASSRNRLIATDGVFSMDGYIARLSEICRLAEKYDAMVMIDDSHSVGFLGAQGRGTHEHCNVMGQVDIITGTLGKALGGASGGYTSGRKEIIDLLRQRSRPYLFSNTLTPSIVTASLKALELIQSSSDLRDKLYKNTAYFREKIEALGFKIKPGEHPIVPIMLGDAQLAQDTATRLIQKGVYVIGFFYPVVPQGEARIRVQISSVHTREDLDFALQKFSEVR
ncbi:MAG: 2-amino-3-ketobutyrate coenzyme A ligase [Candidatus Moanabacter tarae]|uniref:2-amino-3-ketobutyrate coenzyme A ligase n=1 Tax=Candidatus Moanibacter tarae TaxID=2200854 RepID=A0A2Z4AG86_9BACT|nr:MAG: 2-amino-3-ketobutyrate coenzyme A ligase [Candidatus Moanabacter tarae]|tara:strand:+ start:6676 stop:7845 length:1170 start_codon:yes stop_codon:yes gene_type:complete